MTPTYNKQKGCSCWCHTNGEYPKLAYDMQECEHCTPTQEDSEGRPTTHNDRLPSNPYQSKPPADRLYYQSCVKKPCPRDNGYPHEYMDENGVSECFYVIERPAQEDVIGKDIDVTTTGGEWEKKEILSVLGCCAGDFCEYGEENEKRWQYIQKLLATQKSSLLSRIEQRVKEKANTKIQSPIATFTVSESLVKLSDVLQILKEENV